MENYKLELTKDELNILTDQLQDVLIDLNDDYCEYEITIQTLEGIYSKLRKLGS